MNGLPVALPARLAAAPRQGGVDAPCRIRVLGEFALHCHGRALAAGVARRTHARRLLQCLGSAPRHAERRQRVQQALWPGSDDARARNRLHHTLHWIRKALEEVPSAHRPTLVVGDERVELLLPPGTVVDWSEALALFDHDSADAALRLAALEQGLAIVAGELAPDWIDCPEIEARRRWLADQRDTALREAMALAAELGRGDTALRLARERAQRLLDDTEAQCDYALLLAAQGRPDAALRHCRDSADRLDGPDDEGRARLEATTRAIQRRANSAAAGAAEADAAAGADAGASPATIPAATAATASTAAAAATGTAPAAVAPLLSRSCIAAPRYAAEGYGELLAAAAALLDDPYAALVTLVGPPGAGKSLLAAHAAAALQDRLRHGAVWVDAAGASDRGALQTLLAAALAPLAGPAPPAAQPAAAVADDALAPLLAGRELLVVLDGLPRSDAARGLLAEAAARFGDVRWLVTAHAALGVGTERVLRVDPTLLLAAPAAGAPSPAALLLERAMPAEPGAAPPWPALEQLAHAVDGVPPLLRALGRQLAACAPDELLARLAGDAALPLRALDRGDAAFAAELRDWLARADAPTQRALATLAACRGGLARHDLQALLGSADAAALETFIERSTAEHHLQRRVRRDEQGARSEFRVPRVLAAALAQAGVAPDLRAHEHWIEAGPRAAPAAAAAGLVPDADPGALAGAGARWFDERADDVQAVVERWLDAGAVARLRAFAARHGALWGLLRQPRRGLDWLDRTLAAAPPGRPAPAEQAALLVARARLRVRCRDVVAACDDARRALVLLHDGADGPDVLTLRRDALALLQRHAGDEPLAARPAAAQAAAGLAAGEQLLRVARLALTQGRLADALTVCDQCVALFERFGAGHGKGRALRYRARVAFAAGDLAAALDSLNAVPAALPAGAAAELARCELLRAEIELNDGRFGEAIDRTAAVMARAELAQWPFVLARALQLTAWAHYALGALPVARAVAREQREQAIAAAHLGLLVNASLLEALVEARQQRAAAALGHLAGVLELGEAARGSLDLQYDLINAAELAAALGRDGPAGRLAQALRELGARPGHRLRPWIARRLAQLAAPATPGVAPAPRAGAAGPEMPALSLAALRELAGG